MRISLYACTQIKQGGLVLNTKFFKHKRVAVTVIVSLLLLVSVFFCVLNSNNKNCEIHPHVEAMMNELSISDCYVKSIGDYSNITYQLNSPQISNEEIQSYIESVKSEYSIQEITAEFVAKHYECTSVDVFYQLVENKLLEQEKVEMILSTRQLIVKQLIEQSSFKLDPDIVAQYSLEVVNSYETEAYLHNMSLEDYCSKILEITYDDFFDFCYDEGEKLIKTYLVIGAVAFNELDESTRDDIPTDEQDIYSSYQEIENQVYDIFINTDDNF